MRAGPGIPRAGLPWDGTWLPVQDFQPSPLIPPPPPALDSGAAVAQPPGAARRPLGGGGAWRARPDARGSPAPSRLRCSFCNTARQLGVTGGFWGGGASGPSCPGGVPPGPLCAATGALCAGRPCRKGGGCPAPRRRSAGSPRAPGCCCWGTPRGQSSPGWGGRRLVPRAAQGDPRAPRFPSGGSFLPPPPRGVPSPGCPSSGSGSLAPASRGRRGGGCEPTGGVVSPWGGGAPGLRPRRRRRRV